MSRYKKASQKARLTKQGRRTRWAPFWTIPRAIGKGKRVHPSRLTRVKRSWRNTRLKLKENKKIKSGKKLKKY